MADSLAAVGPEQNPSTVVGVVLAAGAGIRLRPLTLQRPKPLCPVGTVPLLDLALDRVRPHVTGVAVNVHHGRSELEAHLASRPEVHPSIEEPALLGTAGALGKLRPWIAGRGVLVVNADAWSIADLGAFVSEWDHRRPRLLLAGSGEFGPRSRVVASLFPWEEVASLDATPSGLYERSWRPAHAAGRLEVATYDGPFFDCGTPGDYLDANLEAARLTGTGSAGSLVAPSAIVSGEIDHGVVGPGARVEGRIRRSVVWDHAEVGPTERLDRAIRADEGLTVLVGDPHG